ncbi:MAG TPA: T9SS type A sorting domain-containing protein, partial [Chitinispirillaceae bacterium]|nr:T9SS type A sorting domain-containing protein [Chitinispirillaceae bacterium]
QSYFSGHYTDDFTKLTFYCSQKKNNFIYIRTMFLSPDDFSPLADELLKVKCLAVFCDNARNNQNVATISIPYDPADLNGYPESSLAVAYLDYMESDQFLPVSDSIDTINHRITVQLPYLQCGILQVYVKGDVAVNDLPKVALVSGIKTRYVRSQKSLAINLSLPVIENVELRLYNILGKCIQKSTLKAGSGYSTHLWNLKGLPNGKYVLAIKAGKYRKQETLMVLY